MQTLTATWTGVRPLIMHNSQTADALNPYTQKLKEFTSKGKRKTLVDIERMERVEWEAGLYWDDTDGLAIPSDNIEKCIVEGAMKTKKGKDAKAAVYCATPHVRVQYDGPTKIEALYAYGVKNPNTFIFRKIVRVKDSRIVRVRPMIPTGWRLHVEIEFEESIIDDGVLRKAMIQAGALIGLGDYRPKFGRFLVSF